VASHPSLPKFHQQVASVSTACSVDWESGSAGDVHCAELESEHSRSTERRLSYSHGSGSGSSVLSAPSSYGSSSCEYELERQPSLKEQAAFPLEVYGMTHSWLFFVECSLQLLAFAAISSADIRNHLNMVCNAIYTLLYASILASYTLMETPPEPLLVLGVFLCWCAYIAFLAIYCIDLYGVDMSAIGPLYYSGSWLFLVGSVFFMGTTSGVSWWGSTAFGVGSIFFVLDSHGVGNGYINGLIGIFCFLVGRLCFVFASRTERVGLFSITFNLPERRMMPNPVRTISNHGQDFLNRVTLIMDDLKGGSTKRGSVYVEMSLLEKIRVQEMSHLLSNPFNPFNLGKAQETYAFFKGSLVPRCCTEKASQDATVAVDEEQAGVLLEEL